MNTKKFAAIQLIATLICTVPLWVAVLVVPMITHIHPGDSVQVIRHRSDMVLCLMIGTAALTTAAFILITFVQGRLVSKLPPR